MAARGQRGRVITDTFRVALRPAKTPFRVPERDREGREPRLAHTLGTTTVRVRPIKLPSFRGVPRSVAEIDRLRPSEGAPLRRHP